MAIFVEQYRWLDSKVSVCQATVSYGVPRSTISGKILKKKFFE